MRRVVSKQTLLAKNKRTVRRRAVHTVGTSGVGGFYSIIKKKEGIANVCVIRSVGGIGDVLMTTPALKELKRRFPGLTLSYAVDRHRTSNDVYYELVKNLSFIDHIIDARYVDRSKYDAVIDISAVCIRYERDDLPAINRIDLFARALGLTSLRNTMPVFKLESVDRLYATKILPPTSKKIVVLHTASHEEKRCWPIQRYVELVKAAEVHTGIHFVVLDYNKKYSQWKNHPNVTDLSNTNVRQMASVIDRADLFVGPDSGPMHLAGALQTQSLVVFGSIPPSARINHYPSHEAITLSSLNCLGCWYKPCPIKTKCMTGISAILVLTRMLNKLGVENG